MGMYIYTYIRVYIYTSECIYIYIYMIKHEINYLCEFDQMDPNGRLKILD